MSMVLSAISASSDSTTPLPMKQRTFSRRMPDGISDRIVLRPPITSVWPALCPPWKRATAVACSVSRSTTLPLPSSPHCVPITMTNLPTCPPLSHQEQNDQPYQHAAESGDAQLTVSRRQQFLEGALDPAWMQEGGNPFQHE